MNRLRKKYFEIWGDEQAQNVLLKGLLTGLTVLFLIVTLALMVVSLRKPLIIAVGEDKTEIFKITPPGDELLTQELTRTVRSYIQYHYTWDSTSIEKSHEMASHYVSDRFRQDVLSAKLNSDQDREREAASGDHLHSDVKVDPKNLSARVSL